ncbi:tRNA pseudouridine(55) synthase TruB [Crocinitomix catalasitica]|uniref:tRNA pseudouridine(55) synthase TruB n=1 Tax=Crocinitomix catalasitica TaxID=184607 RepID=UPI0004803976|nr:tRNA pseudouridine(55) synthase TruB [Crocinitomix catalasitica]
MSLVPTPEDFKEGQLILVNKPLHWTSFDVVNKLRYELKQQLGIKKIKVGHAGTLDPLADGLLIICTGKKTKEINDYMGLPKTYSGTITIGATTPSFDLETEIDKEFDISHISEDDIRKTAASMIGEFDQQPPIFSAKKVNGKKAYDLARAGEEVILKTKRVTISQFDITAIDFPNITFEITCSSGTYIRSIANDFGESLNNGGYLSSLRRDKIGDFDLKNAKSVEEWIAVIRDGKIS